jgi:hypothetical protein
VKEEKPRLHNETETEVGDWTVLLEDIGAFVQTPSPGTPNSYQNPSLVQSSKIEMQSLSGGLKSLFEKLTPTKGRKRAKRNIGSELDDASDMDEDDSKSKPDNDSTTFNAKDKEFMLERRGSHSQSRCIERRGRTVDFVGRSARIHLASSVMQFCVVASHMPHGEADWFACLEEISELLHFPYSAHLAVVFPSVGATLHAC